ncbi:MAG TPA: hypothetical protein V6D10_17565 [Trichocoleus sp.]|jgi:hypothetical protein
MQDKKPKRKKPQGFGSQKPEADLNKEQQERLVYEVAKGLVGDDPNMQEYFAVAPAVYLEEARKMLGLPLKEQDSA